jgi:predicted CXXCH cytochrome family protein
MKSIFNLRRTRPGLRPAGGIIFLLAVMLAVPGSRGESIINSVHNLSVTSPGTIKAVSETDACIFCHTAHHANGETPLWNHSMSSVSNYVVYSSTRLDSLNLTIPQPNGSSRLCLSCHDGTVALGNVSSGAAVTMQNGVTTMPSGANNLGTDLSQDHPVSFVYDSALAARDPQVKDPSTLVDKVRLDKLGRLQCTACHDPHNNQYGNFLVMDNTGSALCTACHQPPAWAGSVHAISSTPAPAAVTARLAKSTRVAGKAAAPAATRMSAIACANCHMNHGAAPKTHLLQSAKLEDNCLDCHSGSPAKKNLAVDFQKPSVHPITLNSGSHSPVEDPTNPKMRHVVCADCHNAHAATAAPAVAPNASGALAKLTGVSTAGAVISPLTKEYELCYRCHADSAARGPATVQRQYIETNTRLEFSTANQSFHPVVSAGKNFSSVPSLISPWTVNSQMYCTDCHNSDSGPKAGGTGANGPHGSIFRPLLERNLNLGDNQGESAAAYALCYKCHSRSVVLSNASFKYHELHVVEKKTACTTCHDSHGVANAPHLINFNTLYVTNSPTGQISYRSTGLMHGNCTLTCHGANHNNLAY